MNLIGKIFVVLIFVMSLVFMSFARGRLRHSSKLAQKWFERPQAEVWARGTIGAKNSSSKPRRQNTKNWSRTKPSSKPTLPKRMSPRGRLWPKLETEKNELQTQRDELTKQRDDLMVKDKGGRGGPRFGPAESSQT